MLADLRICLVGDFGEPCDMGERNLAHNLAKFIGPRHWVMTLRPKDILSFTSVIRLRKEQPDIVHYLTGPRGQSFVVLWLLKWIGRCKVAVMSAPRPVISRRRLCLLNPIKPDLVLAQSAAHARIFSQCGFKARFLPNGVDTSKFHPVSHDHKAALRGQYAIPRDKYVVLHTGYIALRRGVESLARLAGEPGIYIILVSSTSWIAPDGELLERLTSAGCRVLLEYMPKIEEIYQLSDCFVFPGAGQDVKDSDQFEGRNQSPSIEIPLSVLEALACNLPVVSRRFGGLEDAFPPESSGIFYADSDQQILDLIHVLKDSRIRLDPSQLIKDYTWENIVCQLEELYASLLEVCEL